MYLKRLAELTLREVISGDKVGIVLGARQVGKTTLVEHALQGAGALFLNFDVEVDKARFRAAAVLPPADALRSFGNPPVLVIDEAQRLPEAPRIVKGWFDARLPVRILLLGSSSLDLLDQAAESLTGRNRKLVLPPLLFSETLSAQEWAPPELPHEHLCRHFAPQLRALLLQRLAFGSYPEVVLTPDPARLLRELSADYLWKDVLQTGLVKTLHRSTTEHDGGEGQHVKADVERILELPQEPLPGGFAVAQSPHGAQRCEAREQIEDAGEIEEGVGCVASREGKPRRHARPGRARPARSRRPHRIGMCGPRHGYASPPRGSTKPLAQSIAALTFAWFTAAAGSTCFGHTSLHSLA